MLAQCLEQHTLQVRNQIIRVLKIYSHHLNVRYKESNVQLYIRSEPKHIMQSLFLLYEAGD